MKRTNILCILTSLLLVFACLQTVRAQAPQQQPIIRALDIRGVEHAPAEAREQLQRAITLQVGQPFNRETAQQDVERILEIGWFFRATFRTEPIQDGVRLIYTIEENPVITQVDFIGNTAVSDAELQAVIKTKPGEVLNRDQAVQDARAIRQTYTDRGYIFAEIVDINPTPDGRLEFYIFEPKIGEIRIQGNTKTREQVIRRELEVKPGDLYNTEKIRLSLRNLERLGIFQEVTAVPEPGLEPGTLTLVIQVRERRTGMAAFGVGSSNIDGIIGFVDVSDTNLFGTGQSISARVQFGADSSYQLSYSNPWIDSKRTRMTVNLYDRTILRQAVLADETITYDEKRTGGNISFTRPIQTNTRASITLRADNIKAVEDDDDDGEEEPPAAVAGTRQEGNTKLPPELTQGAQVRSITLSTVRDTRNNYLAPSKGSYGLAAVEFAGFGGADFTKVTGETRRFWTVRKGREAATPGQKEVLPWVIASRLMAGTISGTPPFLDQFLVGGADTLRGFPEDRFPGENMVLLNNELRVPITDALQLVAFVDAGDAWGGRFAEGIVEGFDEGFGDPNFDLHYGFGLGVRVQTPIGPLRLDYGLNSEGGNEFHFGVGQSF